MHRKTQHNLSEMVLQDEVYVTLTTFTHMLLMDIELDSKSSVALLGQGLLLWIPCREPASWQS